MRYALALLPLAGLVLVSLAGAARLRSWRLGLLSGFVVTGLVVLASAELLSAFSALRAWPVAAVHVVLASVGLLGLRRWGPLPAVRRPDRVERAWLVVLGAQMVVLAVLALAAVPNNWDSMVYHMAKVAHWAESGSLQHYPTAISPQLYLAPLAELGVLQLQLLTGGDRTANLVQLLAHVVAVAGVSQIARNLGLPPRAQLVSAVTAATIPMAVAQAVTTQTDYLAAAFLVAGVALATRTPSPTSVWWSVTPAAVAFGLAVATKATAVLFAIPLAGWLVWRLLRGVPLRRAATTLAVAAVVVVALNAGYTLRNLATYGDPLGPDKPSLRMERVTTGTVVGNVVRNAGHNLAVPAVGAVNARTTSVLRGTMGALGVDPDEPSTLFAAQSYDIDAARNEDRASSPLQWLLLLAAGVGVVVSRRLRQTVGGLVLALALGYLLFSVALKWQPWGARLLLPILVLGAVPAAALISRLPKSVLQVALALLVVASTPWLVVSQYRPLLGSESVLTSATTDTLFRVHPDFSVPFQRAAARARATGDKRVGLVTTVDGWEYPFWRLLPGVEIVQVDVRNVSASLAAGPRPDVVISLHRRPAPEGYRVVRYGPVQVEERTGS